MGGAALPWHQQRSDDAEGEARDHLHQALDLAQRCGANLLAVRKISHSTRHFIRHYVVRRLADRRSPRRESAAFAVAEALVEVRILTLISDTPLAAVVRLAATRNKMPAAATARGLTVAARFPFSQ